MRSISPKRLLISLLYGRWRRPCAYEDGYAILLPSPMDMPFLLQYALEGLRRIDTTHCRQVIAVGDGWGDDGGEALRRVVAACDDPRVSLVLPNAADRFVLRRMGRTNGAAAHWMATINGITHARTAHAFLHDSDAFFLEESDLERQYLACRDRGMDTLGVTARSDAFFAEVGYAIPGTWELMFSTRWARSRPPAALRGREADTPRGPFVFDSMLASQYEDYPSGRVGVLDPPPAIAHFNGTIVTYRTFRDRGASRVVDEEFRILLLALLEDQIPAADGARVVPTVAELARGLGDPRAQVSYDSDVAAGQYPVFRGLLDDMCGSPIFRGERAERIREAIRPFDDHFASRAIDPSLVGRRQGAHGLGGER